MNGQPEICLALATYNQAPLLRRFLDNYLNEGASLVPLLVVDDGSADGTADILAALPESARIRVHRLPHVSVSHARNQALRHSPTPWLAFSDTDCLLDRRYFEVLRGLPERYAGAAAVEGAVRPVPGPKPPFHHSLFNPKGGTFATANMAFHVPTVLALGGFDEGFGNYREDADLALTLMDHGRDLPFCPDLVVQHPHVPRDFPAAVKKAYATQNAVILSELRLYRKHPGSYGRVRHHPDASETLRSWQRKYAGLYIRECVQYLLRTPGLTPADRLKGAGLACQAVAIALLEQACANIVCLQRWRDLKRPGKT